MLTEVDVPNPELTLNPGMYAETTIQLQHKNGALILPAQAVVENGDQAYVLVVNTTNHVEKRNVTLGIQTANRVEITGWPAGGRKGCCIWSNGLSARRRGHAARGVHPH